MNKTNITAVVAALALIVGIFAYNRPGTPGPAGRDGANGESRLGSVATLDEVAFPYVKVNGVARYYYSQPITATSSTVCSVYNPFNATATLLNYTVVTTANGLGTQKFDLSTSSTALASSSPAFVKNFTTGTGPFSMVWTANGTTSNASILGNSQGAVGQSDIVLAPADYVNVKVSTSTAGTFSTYLTGSCRGVFQKL